VPLPIYGSRLRDLMDTSLCQCRLLFGDQPVTTYIVMTHDIDVVYP